MGFIRCLWIINETTRDKILFLFAAIFASAALSTLLSAVIVGILSQFRWVAFDSHDGSGGDLDIAHVSTLSSRLFHLVCNQGVQVWAKTVSRVLFLLASCAAEDLGDGSGEQYGLALAAPD